MLIFLKIAWRNIIRNKYRSIITILAIAIGFASLIFIRAFVDGAHYQMIENYTDLVSGHIQIHKAGFQANMGLSRSFEASDQVLSVLKNNRKILSFSSRVKEYALISSAEHSAGVLLAGVEPQKEKQVSKLYKRIRQGDFLSEDKQIIIGKDLARLLNVSLGDKVVVMAQALDGSLASAAYRVCGILEAGAEEIDKGLAVITLKAAQELFVLDNRISELTLRVSSVKDVDLITKELRISLNNLFSAQEHSEPSLQLEPSLRGALFATKQSQLEVLSWKEISPSLEQWVEFDVAFINIILFVVLLVVAAGILNTLLMGILERTHEFGIMLALGTKRAQIILMVGFESVILGTIGVISGLIIGAGSSIYFGAQGINLAAFSTALNEYYTGSIVYTRLSAGYLINYGLVVLITSLIVSLYPAWRAANLKPVEAIRHV